MAFSNRFMNNSPFRKEEESKNQDDLKYTTKKDSGISDAEYAKYFSEGSIHRPNLDEVDLGVVKANKKIGESSIVDTSKGSSFPVGASTETIKQWYANNPPRDTINKVEGKKGLSGMIEGGKEFIQDLKTVVSNPFDAARAIVRTDESSGDFPTSVQDLQALRDLADRDDGSESSEQAKSILSRSSGFNVASAMLGPALTAQTFLDLATGDPTAAVLGKAKKLPTIAKTLKKSKVGQLIKGKASNYAITGEAGVLPAAYIGYKGYKQSKKLK
jgi:hypothetical protein